MGVVDFDPTAEVDNHNSNGQLDTFLSKFDSGGNFQWACTWGGTGSDYGNSVAVDGSGIAYISGHYQDIVDFDPGAGVDSHAANGGEDVSLSRIDSAGNFLWARTWGGMAHDLGYSVAVDGSGNAYVAGGFEGTVDFDPGANANNHTSNGSIDHFLSKFDSGGNLIWACTWGGDGDDYPNSVAVDGSGNACVSGRFLATVDFDPGPGVDEHKCSGGYYSFNVFLSKLDTNGNFLWARTWGASLGESVAADNSGNIFVSGAFTDTIDFDPGLGIDNHTSNGSNDVFLSKFPPDGNW
jgi:hypothetical protein